MSYMWEASKDPHITHYKNTAKGSGHIVGRLVYHKDPPHWVGEIRKSGLEGVGIKAGWVGLVGSDDKELVKKYIEDRFTK